MRETVIARSSKNRLRELWESGVPLDSAWVKYSDNVNDFKLAALGTPPKKYQAVRDDPRYKELEPSLPKTWRERQQELHIVTTMERCSLLYRIYTGDLWAIGCQTLKNGFDEMDRVPRELFFVDPDEGPFHDGVYWAKGQLTMDDESYFDIRVVRLPADSEMRKLSASPKDNTQSSETARTGRPNTKKQIRDAVKLALTTDPDFRALRGRQAQALEIRARLLGEDARHSHDVVGYATNTIKRIIGQVAKRPSKTE